jgi:hypothetical protein
MLLPSSAGAVVNMPWMRCFPTTLSHTPSPPPFHNSISFAKLTRALWLGLGLGLRLGLRLGLGLGFCV